MRQIKEVLSAQDALEMSESSGPLEEIAFWRSRCTDLSGISKQLDQEGVQNIKEILTLSKSVDFVVVDVIYYQLLRHIKVHI